jgi:hypothetical protein
MSMSMEKLLQEFDTSLDDKCEHVDVQSEEKKLLVQMKQMQLAFHGMSTETLCQQFVTCIHCSCQQISSANKINEQRH